MADMMALDSATTDMTYMEAAIPDITVSDAALPDIMPVARCDDGDLNGDETDTDCGGSCGPC